MRANFKFLIYLLLVSTIAIACASDEVPPPPFLPSPPPAPPCPTYAMLWKNGIAQPLTATETDSYANSVFVSHDAGYEYTQLGTSKAMVWKNQAPKALDGDQKFNGEFHLCFRR